MSELMPIIISAIVIVALVIVLSGKLNLSSRYERKPRELNTWSSLDHGIDPTEEKNS